MTIKKKETDQNGAKGRVDKASGQTTKASPGPIKINMLLIYTIT